MKRYINLLPPTEQKQLKLLKVRLQFLHFAWLLTGGLLLLALLLLGTELWQRQELNKVTKEVESQNQILREIQASTLPKRVEKFNLNLENFQVLGKKHQNWSAIFIELARLTPEDASLDSVIVSRLDQKIEITGRARTRESMLAFRNSLLGSKYFTNVNFPLTNLEKAQNVPFKYRFYFKPETLQ